MLVPLATRNPIPEHFPADHVALPAGLTLSRPQRDYSKGRVKLLNRSAIVPGNSLRQKMFQCRPGDEYPPPDLQMGDLASPYCFPCGCLAQPQKLGYLGHVINKGFPG